MENEYPQIVTQITDNGVSLTTVVDAPWVSVTSVNGMTGDVQVELLLEDYQHNHFYKKNTAVIYNGGLYYAKQDFTSGATFDPSDWNETSAAQVQADYTEQDTTAKSYIKHKPTSLTDIDPNYVAYSTTEKTKLAGIASGAEVNVKSNWNESNSSSDAYIENKPTIPSKTSDLTNDSDYTTKTYVDTELDDVAKIGSVISTPSDRAYVDTSNIIDGAVTGDKIDWATLSICKFGEGAIPSNTGSSSGTFTLSIADAPAGSKWLAIITGSMYLSSGKGGNVRIDYDTTGGTRYIDNKTSTAATEDIGLMRHITKVAGMDTVTFYYHCDGNAGGSRLEYAVLRVG